MGTQIARQNKPSVATETHQMVIEYGSGKCQNSTTHLDTTGTYPRKTNAVKFLAKEEKKILIEHPDDHALANKVFSNSLQVESLWQHAYNLDILFMRRPSVGHHPDHPDNHRNNTFDLRHRHGIRFVFPSKLSIERIPIEQSQVASKS